MKKDFDCLKMKEEIQAQIYMETKDMTFPELDAYFNKGFKNTSPFQYLVRRDNARKMVYA